MPNFDFTCKKCKRSWEVFLMIRDVNKPQNCEKCGKKGHREIGAGGGILFKGGGFYTTENRSEHYKTSGEIAKTEVNLEARKRKAGLR